MCRQSPRILCFCIEAYPVQGISNQSHMNSQTIVYGEAIFRRHGLHSDDRHYIEKKMTDGNTTYGLMIHRIDDNKGPFKRVVNDMFT